MKKVKEVRVSSEQVKAPFCAAMYKEGESFNSHYPDCDGERVSTYDFLMVLNNVMVNFRQNYRGIGDFIFTIQDIVGFYQAFLEGIQGSKDDMEQGIKHDLAYYFYSSDILSAFPRSA